MDVVFCFVLRIVAWLHSGHRRFSSTLPSLLATSTEHIRESSLAPPRFASDPERPTWPPGDTSHLPLRSSGSRSGACALVGHRASGSPCAQAPPTPPRPAARRARGVTSVFESSPDAAAVTSILFSEPVAASWAPPCCRVASFASFGLDCLAGTVRRRTKRARCQGPPSVPGDALSLVCCL